MLLLWGLREFPRLTVVFAFFVYRQEVFQPLLYYTSETEIEESFYEVRTIDLNQISQLIKSNSRFWYALFL